MGYSLFVSMGIFVSYCYEFNDSEDNFACSKPFVYTLELMLAVIAGISASMI